MAARCCARSCLSPRKAKYLASRGTEIASKPMRATVNMPRVLRRARRHVPAIEADQRPRSLAHRADIVEAAGLIDGADFASTGSRPLARVVTSSREPAGDLRSMMRIEDRRSPRRMPRSGPQEALMRWTGFEVTKLRTTRRTLSGSQIGREGENRRAINAIVAGGLPALPLDVLVKWTSSPRAR